MSVRSKWWLSALVVAACTPVSSVQTPGAYQGASDSESTGGRGKKSTRGSDASREAADDAQATGVESQGLGVVAPASAIEQLISSDAASNGGANVIYATIGHLAPDGQQNDKLETVRLGMVKVLNSVSTKPQIVNLTAIDPGKSVYRINLADFNQAGALPRIKTAPFADSNVSTVGGATVVKGDWLVYALSRPEVYDPIMKLPQLGKLFDAQVGANWANAKYVKVSHSEVAFNKRLLARIPIEMGGKPGGYYWRSYDFVRADVQERAFQDPSSVRTTQIPEFVAGEFFFSLPNGLQGYYLTGFGDQHRYDVPVSGAGGISPPVATDYRRPQDGLSHCVGGKAP